MNQQQRKRLVEYRISKARETLADIEILVQNKMWNLAVNRLYYACFYAVTALLANADVFTKTHTGARQMLWLHFVKDGKISNASSIFYSEIFSKRQTGDYEDFIDFEEDDVIVLINPARELINEIESILLKK